MTELNKIYQADSRKGFTEIPDNFIHCCVTSPPYYGLRDYQHRDQIGLEKTPEAYIRQIVEIGRGVRRVLRKDGTFWLNLGDSYSHGGCGTRDPERWPLQSTNDHMPEHKHAVLKKEHPPAGAKLKDLLMMPARVALALQADGWYLRQDIIWHKTNPMPASVKDRPTSSHEYIFLLAKSKKYYYDHEAIKEPCLYGDHPRNGRPGSEVQAPGQVKQTGLSKIRTSGNKLRAYGEECGRPGSHLGSSIPWMDKGGLRNKRDVWSIATKPFKGAHFAVFPPELIRPCILAGCPGGGVVLDPFMGSGTTAVVAKNLGRNYIGYECNPEFIAMANQRLSLEMF